jgi:MFS family permease
MHTAALPTSSGEPIQHRLSVVGKTGYRHPSLATLRGIDWLNFFLADVQMGVGPFIAIYVAGYHWNEQQVGIALTVSSMAGILTQTPAGWLVDSAHAKRALIILGLLAMVAGALTIAFFPSFWPVMTAQVLIGGMSSLFGPAICAISLGVVGHQLFDYRQGRNQAFNSAGNVAASLSMGLLGYFCSDRSIFFFVAASAIPTLLALRFIKPKEIDYELARGGEAREDDGKPSNILTLLEDKPLVVFLVCAVMFHFANAAMLPLLGELLSKGQGRSAMMFMAACVITTQITITALATWSGRKASVWGRKPLLLIGFAVLPIRGILYTLTHKAALLVAIQVLDGVGAGIFGVVSTLVVADLTRGTGRFNLSLGAIAAAVGIGASLSQIIAGCIVQHFGYNTGFLFLSAIAAAALAVLYFFMPETDAAATPMKTARGSSC